MFFEIFCQPTCFFCCSIYFQTAQNSREECNEFANFCFSDYHYAFQETVCPVTLAHEIFLFYSSLYFYTSNTFRLILARLSHILVYTNFFFMYIITQNIFFLSLMTLLLGIKLLFLISAVKGLI